jgi:hypothetical protein
MVAPSERDGVVFETARRHQRMKVPVCEKFATFLSQVQELSRDVQLKGVAITFVDRSIQR